MLGGPRLPPGHARGWGVVARGWGRRHRSTGGQSRYGHRVVGFDKHRVPPLQIAHCHTRLGHGGRQRAACGYLPIPALPMLARQRGRGCCGDRTGGRGERALEWQRGHALSSQVPLVSSPRGTGSLWKWEGRLRLGEAPAQDPFTQAARRWSSGRRHQLLPTPWTQRNRDPLPALCRPPPCLRGPTHRSCMAATAATYNTLSLAGEGGARPEAGAWPLLCSLQSPTCTGAWQVLHWRLNGDSHETEPQTHCPVW